MSPDARVERILARGQDCVECAVHRVFGVRLAFGKERATERRDRVDGAPAIVGEVGPRLEGLWAVIDSRL